MSVTRVAVLGTYRSGSNVVAAMLNALGVDMGPPFRAESFEPADLSGSLSRWWSGTELSEQESASNRVHLLRQWAESRHSAVVGCKHPFLGLSAHDILRAWGNATKFIWAHRPLPEAIDALEKQPDCASARQIQERIYRAIDGFFPRPNGLVVNFSDLITNPKYVVSRLAEFVGVSPSEENLRNAIAIVRRETSSDAPPSASARLKLVAAMIANSSPANLTGAIQSVIDRVDQLLLLDVGLSEGALNAVRAMAANKLQYRKFKWTNNSGEAKNEALNWAAEIGADWVCSIDPNEHLSWSNYLTRTRLDGLLCSRPDVKVWLAKSSDGTYYKERFVKVDAGLSWQGKVHEALIGASATERGKMEQLLFTVNRAASELSKEFTHDLQTLREEIRQFPDSGNAWYYLGQTLVNLNHHEGAIAAFDKCSIIRDSQEQAAWACYMSAKSHAALGLFEEAIERCGTGLSIHSYFPEIAWLAAWCWYQLGQFHQAIAWSNMSICLGAEGTINKYSNRFGFRDLIGWYEGPYDVLAHCYRKLGDEESATRAGQESARSLRLRTETSGVRI